MTDAGADEPGRVRRTWVASCRFLGRLGWTVVVLGYLFALFGGCLVAYQDLTGPHCDGHRMGQADTCSVVAAPTSRSSNTIERLNPAGTAPAVLTAPAAWHAKPQNIHQGVYTPDQMRDFHRGVGRFMLAFTALLLLIPGSWIYRAVRARRSPATAAATAVDR